MRSINVILCCHFPTFAQSFTLIVPLETSYWARGGAFLLLLSILKAKEANPKFRGFLDRILDPTRKQENEYAQATFVPARRPGIPPAEVLQMTVTDTRDEAFQRLITGVKVEGDDPRDLPELPPEEVE
jgi:hypothetical protein